MFLFTLAFAQATATAGAAPAKPSLFESLIPFVIMFGVIYFLMLRPQSKQRKDHVKFISELKRGDIVITAGGIIGRIDNINDKFVTLEVEDGGKMKVIRSYVLSSAMTNDKTPTTPQPKA